MPENEPILTPAVSGAAGLQPLVGTSTPPVTDQTSQTPAASPATPEPVVDNPAAQKAAQEAARYRTELREAQKRIAEFEAAQQVAENAKLSELERAQKAASDALTERDRIALTTQERVTRAEVRAAAASLGLNPELAQRIVDYAALTYDDNGDPTNVAAVLSQAIADYGLHPQTPAVQPAPIMGATNPQRQAGPLIVTPSQYSDPEYRRQYMRDYGEDLLSAIAKGKVKFT